MGATFPAASEVALLQSTVISQQSMAALAAGHLDLMKATSDLPEALLQSTRVVQQGVPLLAPTRLDLVNAT